MKARLGLIIVSLSVLFLAVGCAYPLYAVVGSGNVITQSRPVSNFDSATLSGVGDITITQGDTESLTVEAEDNVMPHITTEVINRRLNIGFDNQDWATMIHPTKPIKFNLSLKNLSVLEVSGTGNVQAASIKTDRLNTRVSGAGNIRIDRLEATSLNTTLSGAGNVEVAGQVTNQDSSMTGLGNMKADNLKSQMARVTVSGAGSATIWAQESLDVTISGAGSVKYFGSPKVTQRITGVGDISYLGSK